MNIIYKVRDDIQDLINRSVTATIEELAIEASSNAKALCPVDGGQLRNSIQYKITKPSGKVIEAGLNDSPGANAAPTSLVPEKNKGILVATAPYAPYVEYGTRFQRPQSFMRAALDLSAGYNKKDVIKAINKEAKEWELKHPLRTKKI